jgi:hypothetical protein
MAWRRFDPARTGITQTAAFGRLFAFDALLHSRAQCLFAHLAARTTARMAMTTGDPAKLDRIVADARRAATERGLGYRDRALKIYPWICGRCAREFTRANLRELTVHHRNHDHNDNPVDGSNWELLCLYCHDNEHQRQLEAGASVPGGARERPGATQTPFADLKALLDARRKPE